MQHRRSLSRRSIVRCVALLCALLSLATSLVIMSKAPSSSSSSTPLLLAAGSAVGAGVAAGLAVLLRSLQRKSNRSNAKLRYDLAQQISALQSIYPRLCKEFIADVEQSYAFPAFALERLQRLFDYTILGGKYYRATLVLNTLQELAQESGQNIDNMWEGGLVLGWCIEIVRRQGRTNHAPLRSAALDSSTLLLHSRAHILCVLCVCCWLVASSVPCR